MTYGTLFQSSTRQADQCSSRAIERTLEPCRSCRETCRSLWDVHATSVSIFADCSNTATTSFNPGEEDTFHRQVSAQCRCSATPTRQRSPDVVRGFGTARHHRLLASRRTQWLSDDCQPKQSSWNTVLIAYSLRNYPRPINCWYPRNLGWLTTQ